MHIDLNVPYTKGAAELRKSLLTLPELHYDGCALNLEISGRKKPDHASCIEKVDISATKKVIPASFAVHGVPRAFQQWTRVTVFVDEEGQLPALMGTSALLASYDLVAVRPATTGPSAHQLFTRSCTSLDVDIVSIELSTRLPPGYLRPAAVASAVARGVHFEIHYAAALRDSTARRNLIGNAQLLVRATRGRNLLLSSEARRAIDFRSAYDVVQLASLFGLNAAAARACLTTNARAALAHGEVRRVHGAIIVEAEEPEMRGVAEHQMREKKKGGGEEGVSAGGGKKSELKVSKQPKGPAPGSAKRTKGKRAKAAGDL